MHADEDADPGGPAATDVVRAPRRIRLGLGAAVVVALVAVSLTVGVGLLARAPSEGEIIPTTPRPSTSGAAFARGAVYAHVLGAVTRPGLYVLDDGARVADLLAAAGGTGPDADLRGVNLARLVVDGEQVVVPVIGAASAASDPDAHAGAGAPGGATGKPLVDLNTADAAALEELPRVGPALAQRIIDWRAANGRFTSVDDLLGVPGIGDKMLASIRDLVRV